MNKWICKKQCIKIDSIRCPVTCVAYKEEDKTTCPIADWEEIKNTKEDTKIQPLNLPKNSPDDFIHNMTEEKINEIIERLNNNE